VAAYVAACIVAGLAASIYLHQKHGRHPMGDERGVAVRWWTSLVALDIGVAAGLLTGTFTVVSLEHLQGSAGVARGLAIGLFGPLALRSPVREVRIGGRSETVGITYLYDRARIFLERGLDERITRLRRADRKSVVEEIERTNWDSTSLRGRLDEHLDDRKTLHPADRERIERKIISAMTLPADQRLSGLVKVILDERFTGLLDDLKAAAPTAKDRRRGRDARKRDAELLRSEAEQAVRRADGIQP
jgi:hypothetical protein